MEYSDWFASRLTKLRMEKGVSARDMSLSLGQSESYINKIENRRTLPSMGGFFFICEYLGVTPCEFFDSDMENPQKLSEFHSELSKLEPRKLEHILDVVRDLNSK